MKGKQRRTNGGEKTERETDRDKERRLETQKTLQRNNSLEWDKSKRGRNWWGRRWKSLRRNNKVRSTVSL